MYRSNIAINSLAISLLLIMAETSNANNCSDVLKLSAITSESVQTEESFNKEAASFCREYAKSQGSTNKAGGSVGYGGFTLGGTSAKSNSEAIAEKLCKSNNKEQLRENAYRTYIRTIAPQAYSSYNQCISSGDELRINLLGGTEKHASIRVAFNSQSVGNTAGIIVDSNDTVKCIWKNSQADIDTQLSFTNGQSKILKCNRKDSSEEGYITIVDERSSKKNAYLNIPWSAYKVGVPVYLAQKYENAIIEIEAISKSLSGSVVAFNKKKCPEDWEPYTDLYGRFIRGLDKSKKIDPKRKLGSIQDDTVQEHIHANMYANHGGNNPAVAHHGASDKNAAAKTGGIEKARHSNETRPKNVALLYCEKK